MRTSIATRVFPLIAGLLGAVLLLSGLPAGAGAEARLVAADSRGVTLEFDFPGLRVDTVVVNGRSFSRVLLPGGALADAPGLPELPGMSALVGLPETGRPRLSVVQADGVERAALPPEPAARQRLSVDKEDLPVGTTERIPNAAAYSRAGLWPGVIAALGPEASVRLQRTQSLGVRPARYDAARGVLWLASRIVVRVDFGAGGSSGGPSGGGPGGGLGGGLGGGSAVQPGGLNPLAGLAGTPEGAAEESMYRGLLLNYDQARGFRMGRPRAALPAVGRGGAARSAAGVGFFGTQGVRLTADDGFPEFKLRVDSTGIYKVTVAQLAARLPASATLPAIPVADLRCWVKYPGTFALSPLRECEVPIHVVDADSDGFFDHDDYFVFNGLNLASRHAAHWFDPDSTSLHYTSGEVYWVGSRSGTANARMPERGSMLGLASTYTPSAFRYRYRREDHIVQVPTSDSLDENHFHLTSQFADDTTMVFRVTDLDASRKITVRMAFRGGLGVSTSEDFREHHYTAEILRPQGVSGTAVEPVVADRVFLDRGIDLYDSDNDPNFTLDGTHLSTTRNVLHLVGKHPLYPGGPLSTNAIAFLEWYEVLYYRRFLAATGIGFLSFNSGDTLGALDINVKRFREPSIEIYDVSDPFHPAYINAADRVSGTGANYQVTFQDTVPTAPHAYFAGSRSYLPTLPDAQVALDTASDLAGIPGADMILITHGSLDTQAQALAAEHRQQGLSVVVANVVDVYDEFDGGRKSDVAIKRFLRHAFYEWTPVPRYVLLLGEASANPQGYLLSAEPSSRAPARISHTDLVPAPHLFGSVSVEDPEIDSEDHWYVAGLDTLDQTPIFPAMGIGRISTSTPDLAQNVVDKILLYEQPSSDDTWRSRNLFVSDDQWSNGISFGTSGLQFNPNEALFKAISRTLPTLVAGEGGFSYFGEDSFYTSTYTDSIHSCDIPGTIYRDEQCVQDWCLAHMDGSLWHKMSNGYLIVNYQGHANLDLWAHEYIFVNSFIRNDVDQLTNLDRPFLVTAFGCHVNEFDNVRENDVSPAQGDGEGERILYAARKGAIGVFASTGYEWLPTVSDTGYADLNYELFRSFFVHPPDPDIGGDRGVKWVLGDVLRSTKSHFLARVLGIPGVLDTLYPGLISNLPWCGYACPPPGVFYSNNNPFEVYTYCLLGDPALHMNPGPANLALQQDGQPVDTFGYLRGAASGADSVTLTAQVASPVGLDSVWLEERGSTGGTRAVPRAAYTVVSTSPADTASPYARHYALTYRTEPEFRDYYVDFKARNVERTVSTTSLHRVLAASAISSDRGPVDPDHTLPSDITFQSVVTSSTPIDSSRFQFVVDGRAIAPTAIVPGVDPVDQGGLRHWAYSLHQTFLPGLNTICLRGIGSTGIDTVTACATFRVAAGEDFTLGEVINYPNPFERTTGFHFSLTQPADDIRVRIFTISGRMLRELEDASHDAGVHFLAWDGLDADHDPLSNGVYLYKVQVRSGTHTLEKIGRMVKVQ